MEHARQRLLANNIRIASPGHRGKRGTTRTATVSLINEHVRQRFLANIEQPRYSGHSN